MIHPLETVPNVSYCINQRLVFPSAPCLVLPTDAGPASGLVTQAALARHLVSLGYEPLETPLAGNTNRIDWHTQVVK